MSQTTCVTAHLGVDIAKATFDVALLAGEDKPQRKRFSNDEEGFSLLESWLAERFPDEPCQLHVCMEATSYYGDALARYLHEKGYKVSVVNPLATHAFAKSELSRTKTDKVDAGRIARFCRSHRPRAWTPPSKEISELSALVKRLESLQQMKQMEMGRLENAQGLVKASLEAVLSFLEEQIKKTQRLIKEHIEQHPQLKEQRDLLRSIPGIGEATAAILLCEMGDVSRFGSSRQAAAFAGLCPTVCESGSSVRGRGSLCKLGRFRLRKALYFPAMVALRCNPALQAFQERLSKEGKRPMVILAAAMRKLLVIAFGVLKSKKPFDPALAGPPTP